MNALDLPGLPRDAGGPVFAEPWQAKAFAMTLALHEKGLFTWPEWAQTLSQQFASTAADGKPDCGHDYYDHWLAALETMVVTKQAATTQRLAELKDAWDRAAHATPHGQPIVLANT